MFLISMTETFGVGGTKTIIQSRISGITMVFWILNPENSALL